MLPIVSHYVGHITYKPGSLRGLTPLFMNLTLTFAGLSTERLECRLAVNSLIVSTYIVCVCFQIPPVAIHLVTERDSVMLNGKTLRSRNPEVLGSLPGSDIKSDTHQVCYLSELSNFI